MFMVDLAVPRDIEPEVKDLSDVFLYTVDDLAQVVKSGKDQRQAAVVQAEAIIDAGVRQFMNWMGQRHSVPLIQHLHMQTAQWQAIELEKAQRRLSKGEPVDQVMQQLAQGLTQKLLHPALSALHKGDPAQREQTALTLAQLFDAPRREPGEI
jgi:glutamyl-tRNA reductase